MFLVLEKNQNQTGWFIGGWELEFIVQYASCDNANLKRTVLTRLLFNLPSAAPAAVVLSLGIGFEIVFLANSDLVFPRMRNVT